MFLLNKPFIHRDHLEKGVYAVKESCDPIAADKIHFLTIYNSGGISLEDIEENADVVYSGPYRLMCSTDCIDHELPDHLCELPEEVRFIAMDSDGTWFGYDRKPQFQANGKWYCGNLVNDWTDLNLATAAIGHDLTLWQIPTIDDPRDSLYMRPDGCDEFLHHSFCDLISKEVVTDD